MAHPVAPSLTQDIALHCDDERGRPMAFMATFDYREDDPYAVGVTFHVPAGEVPWVMARCLLHQGLTRPAGDGDIRLAPGIDEEGRAVVRMTFDSPEGRLRAAARTEDLLGFLIGTWALVPIGHEAPLVDLDSMVESLRA
ncbi:SsgA family sporulation/cell division regulator [Nocardioides sp.]|uniref:SsgA family sporulation/cell division regulator n=1 Tax=Nocardioides sp. TaxID=35761 RepID=UPI0032196985